MSKKKSPAQVQDLCRRKIKQLAKIATELSNLYVEMRPFIDTDRTDIAFQDSLNASIASANVAIYILEDQITVQEGIID